jgi:hypothetical protein
MCDWHPCLVKCLYTVQTMPSRQGPSARAQDPDPSVLVDLTLRKINNYESTYDDSTFCPRRVEVVIWNSSKPWYTEHWSPNEYRCSKQLVEMAESSRAADLGKERCVRRWSKGCCRPTEVGCATQSLTACSAFSSSARASHDSGD